MSDRAQPIEEQRERPAVVVGRRLEPAGERAEEGARVAIAQAHLGRRAAVGDRAQRLGDRVRRRPRQAHELATARRHPLDHGADVAAVERGDAGEQAMQDQAAGEHVALGGGSLRAQGRGLERRCAAVAAARRGDDALGRLGHGDRERHHARLAALVDEDVVQLKVEVGDAGVVTEGEAAQHAGDPAAGIVHRRRRMLREPLVEGDADAAVDGDERPVLVDAALGHLGEVGMIEARRTPRRDQPVADARGAGRRQPRHRQQRLGAGAHVGREPEHGQLALREQAAQGKVAEGARRRRRADERSDSRRHRGHGVGLIGAYRSPRRWRDQRRENEVSCREALHRYTSSDALPSPATQLARQTTRPPCPRRSRRRTERPRPAGRARSPRGSGATARDVRRAPRAHG